jgi:hypothetical protein
MYIRSLLLRFLFFFRASWLVFVTAIVCFSFYEKATKPLIKEYARLEEVEKHFKLAIQKNRTKQEDLSIQVAYQDTPEWVEELLISRLGVIPEGYTKVYYKKATDSQ